MELRWDLWRILGLFGMIGCRYCNVEFCQSCHKLLLAGELPKRICGKDHSFIVVPYLTSDQVFKEGEVFIDGKGVPLEQWKANVKKQYALK